MSGATFPPTPTKIMLLGTFHFEDAGLNVYKPKFKVDVKAKQDEVREVIELLAAYQPTKIAVERRFEQQTELNRSYQAFVQGKLELSGHEVDQLGFQLAKRLEHGGLYCVDAWGRYYDPPLDFERFAQELSRERFPDFHPYEDLETYAKQHAQTHLLSEWSDYYHRLYQRADEEKMQQTLRETLTKFNTLSNLLEYHGNYLVDAFKVGVGNEYPGVDFITAWYSRNLRIFANLQRITEPPGERILLIIGGGHVPILRHCAEASPEYDLVEVAEYL